MNTFIDKQVEPRAHYAKCGNCSHLVDICDRLIEERKSVLLAAIQELDGMEIKAPDFHITTDNLLADARRQGFNMGISDAIIKLKELGGEERAWKE